jgi:hypothetical protein
VALIIVTKTSFLLTYHDREDKVGPGSITRIMVSCKMFSKLNSSSNSPVFGIQQNFQPIPMMTILFPSLPLITANFSTERNNTIQCKGLKLHITYA